MQESASQVYAFIILYFLQYRHCGCILVVFSHEADVNNDIVIETAWDKLNNYYLPYHAYAHDTCIELHALCCQREKGAEFELDTTVN